MIRLEWSDVNFNAAIVRVHGTNKGIAACCDVTPRYVLADPEMGTKQAVAESKSR